MLKFVKSDFNSGDLMQFLYICKLFKNYRDKMKRKKMLQNNTNNNNNNTTNIL